LRSSLSNQGGGIPRAFGAESPGLAGEAYATVRDRILRGELGIGQPVSRRRLGAELGMSSVAVSEALLRLERDGLLESRPRAGTRVRIPTWDDVVGHYVLREALEAKAAALFAEHATRDERSELTNLATRVDNVMRQPEGNWTICLNLHEKLHRRVAECARCQALADELSRVNALGSIWLLAMHPREHVTTHEKLVNILITEDPEAVALAMRAHIKSELEVSLPSLRQWIDQRKVPRTYARETRIARLKPGTPACQCESRI